MTVDTQKYWSTHTRHVSAVLAKEAAKPFMATVTAVSGARYQIRRPENSVPDPTFYPCVSPNYKPVVGDHVRCLDQDGGVTILGRDLNPADRDIGDLSAKKLERDGSQPMTGRFNVDRGTSSEKAAVTLSKDAGTGVLPIAVRFHQDTRYTHRLEATDQGFFMRTGDETSTARSDLHVDDVFTSGGVALSNRLSNAAGAVNTPNVAAGAITNAKMAKPSVGDQELFDGKVFTPKLADEAVTFAKLAKPSVGTIEIFDLNVTTAKIAGGAVTAAKLAKPSVGTNEVFDLSLTTPKIADEAITFAKLAKPCVGSIEIFDGHVINAKLAGDSVTRSKVAASTIGGVECGDSIKNAASNIFSLRTINNVVGAAAPFHVHSDLYKTWPKADRRRFLDVRRALEGYRRSPRLSHLQGTARLEELDRRLDTLAEA
ncbi:MAG: hypothetical protein M3P49_17825, partial [Actinomycetota bacterium]|nr:hypothetical protein [Actinomycetota bacterium]